MEIFFKATTLILITAILCLFLGQWKKDMVFLLSISACCIVAAAATTYLRPILSLLDDLKIAGGFQNEFIEILLKSVGIAFLSEIACMICADAGNQSLSKMLHLLSSCAILYLSIPIFQSLLTMLMEILSNL